MGAVPACQPFAIAEELDPGAVDQQGSGPGARRLGTCTVMVFCRRLRVEKSGTGQSSPVIDRMLATIPVVCRNGRPNSTFTIRQNGIAPSLNTGGRPLRPALGARHTMALSSQISSDPRRFRASL